MPLRDYQEPAYKTAVDFFLEKNPKPSILVAPTAFGKSWLIAYTANDIKGKTLIVQPSKELLIQNYEKFTLMGGHAGIYSASVGVKKFGNIMYATIGSIKNIGTKFASLGFENLIIDEVHLYPRDTESMLGQFLIDSGIKKVLGLTATPFKLQSNTDQSGNRYSKLQMLTSRSKMGHFFSEIIHVTQISELTSRGYWSRLEYELHEFSDKGLVFNSALSDYTEESLAFNYEQQEIMAKILHRLRSLDRKSVLIFVPTVADAMSLERSIPDCRAVYAEMPPKEREQVIRDFRSGRIKYVANVNILATGFDHTKVDGIILGRKTASLAWLYQAIGRGTRIDPDKENCLVIDFVGNIHRFGRIEYLYFKKKKTWQLYGENGRLLTGIPMHQTGQFFDSPASGLKLEFGKYKGSDISQVPIAYIEYMLREFTWTERNQYLKEACEKRMQAVQTA